MFGETYSGDAEKKKRPKPQSNKRKKIRKILTEDKLQEETIRALKEEEERQKRLELQAQHAKEATKTTLPAENDTTNPNAVTDVSFMMREDDQNYADLAYNFDFPDNLETLNYEDIPDSNLDILAATPVSEFETLLSPTAQSQEAMPQSAVSSAQENFSFTTETTPTMPQAPTMPSVASSSSLSGEVARFEQLLRPTPPVSRTPVESNEAIDSSLQKETSSIKSESMTDLQVNQPALLPPSGQQVPPADSRPVVSPAFQPPQTSSVQYAAPHESQPTSTSTDQMQPHLQRLLSSTVPAPSGHTLLLNGGVPSVFGGPLPRYQSTMFRPPAPAPKPVRQTSEVICISSESSDDELIRKKGLSVARPSSETINISSGSESADDVIFAGTDDNEIAEEDPDVNNSGMHVNDAMNQPDAQGRVLVNKNRPPDEPEIFLSPRLASAVKPHQIGGIRFMFDNIVESLEHYKKSSGFGCILAHSMGLGKTLQVIAFIDLFLRHTGARTALCIVPVNTLLNWVSEFELWLPAKENTNDNSESSREFKVRLLSEMHKTTEARANVISTWKEEGGVLLMGYEMFRVLTNQKLRRRKKKKPKRPLQPGEIIYTVDLDEEDRMSELTAEIYERLVRPGPDLIVCDEGHRIKNSHASISQALKQIATRRRIVLTGYPLQNNLMEYWCMVDFVRPNFLGTKPEFSNMFERPILNGQCADSNAADIRLMRFRSHVLHSLLKGFVQRRSHVVLRNSLPPKDEYVLMIRLSPWQKKLYNNFIKFQMRNGSGSWCSALNPIKAFSICCKIWNHPDVLYRTVVRKTLEQQGSSNLLDMDLDLPDAILDGVAAKNRRKKKDISNILLSDIRRQEKTAPETTTTTISPDGKLLQSVGLNPFGQEEKGLNYDWAKSLLQDYVPNQLQLSGKMTILMEIVHHSIAHGDKILVFSQSLTTLTLIEEFLFDKDVPNPPGGPIYARKWRRNESYLRLDGNTSTTDRERMIQSFNDKNNNTIHLFLLSTRAGCLGINLVGANRVVVFDISWNPCHDAQAVCRVYRYGQTKKCIIYRLICDQSMEKKIYDRQISKQGMSDRVVDELNPIQSLERQDVAKLLIYDDEDQPYVDLSNCEEDCTDETLVHTCKTCGNWLTKKPFHHESLLMDCKGQRLTKAEKRAAQKGYEQEKRASSSCNYSRPSYARFYAAAGYPNKKKPGTSSSLLPNSSTTTADKPVANVRPVQSTPYPLRMGGPLNQGGGFDSRMIEVLQRSGISVKKIIANADVPMPGQSNSPGATPSNAPPLVAMGQPFYMIQGNKGLYIGTTSGRIFALRSHKQEERNAQSPLVRMASGQMVTSREQESLVIKSVFNSMLHPMQQPIGNQYAPQQPMGVQYPTQNPRMQNFSNAVPPQRYVNPMQSDLMNLMTGQTDKVAGLNVPTQQNNLLAGQIGRAQSMTQQNMAMTQSNTFMGLNNPAMWTGGLRNGLAGQNPAMHGSNMMTKQSAYGMSQQNNMMSGINMWNPQMPDKYPFSSMQVNNDAASPDLDKDMGMMTQQNLNTPQEVPKPQSDVVTQSLVATECNAATQQTEVLTHQIDSMTCQNGTMTQQNTPVFPQTGFMPMQSDTVGEQSPLNIPTTGGSIFPTSDPPPVISQMFTNFPNQKNHNDYVLVKSATGMQMKNSIMVGDNTVHMTSQDPATPASASEGVDTSNVPTQEFFYSVNHQSAANPYSLEDNQAPPTGTQSPLLSNNEMDFDSISNFSSNWQMT